MRETSGREKKQGNGRVLTIVIVICLLGAIVSVAFLISGESRKEAEVQKLQELAEQTNNVVQKEEPQRVETTPSSSAAEETQENKTWEEMTLAEKEQVLEEKLHIDIPEKDLDFAVLQEETNSDIYAWIYIPDTKIDYPVLQHPENNAYYLYYNMDGSRGYPGCIYTENYNTKDFTDFNTVLYGHNMKNGTMFAGLHKYEDEAYFKEHPYVYVYTEDDIFVYQIYGAYEFSDIHLLKGYDYDSTNGRIKYLNEVKEVRSMNSVFDDSLEVTENSHILTMSTCISKKPNNRFLVQAVLLNDLLDIVGKEAVDF